MLFLGSRKRPTHFGPYPLERLPRDVSVTAQEAARSAASKPMAIATPTDTLGGAARKYIDLYREFRDGEVAPRQAPVPDDLLRRAADLKGFAYFLDADQVGIATMASNNWYTDGARQEHDRAIVLLVAHGREPELGNLAEPWCRAAGGEPADMRATEILVGLASYIRLLGWSARAHVPAESDVDLEGLAILAGVALRADGGLASPYLGQEFSIAAVTTDYPVAVDQPLAAAARRAKGLGYMLGVGGAVAGLERWRRARRPSHMSRHAMEMVKRVDRPTTAILDDEVPRVPQRAAFFARAKFGDLGAKAKREITRFAFKSPTALSVTRLIHALAPHQDGPVAARSNDTDYADPEANAKALKSLSYFLGAELTGICEIPRYAWYSHRAEGAPIEPYHRYAVVMLIDQGYDTMEGASGDDWISGLQSMRAYLRGAEIAGVMAEHLRAIGFPARPQTNRDSDVLQIPLVLLAGLGELSRIGELVLNPFVGPRFKSVVMTTDMPLAVDKPIDFGLQTFCGNCQKCARECPCDAIPFADKVMFNGYEMWKPDVERCARYRITNPKGSACGRCMKTCPLNKVTTLDGPLYAQVGTWLGINAGWLKPLLVPIATRVDDWLGNGRRQLQKKWWFDLEVVDGCTVEPTVGTNERELDPGRKFDAAKQKIAYYNADVMPPPDSEAAVPLDRKAALMAADRLETPLEALARQATETPPPAHYRATPPRSLDAQ